MTENPIFAHIDRVPPYFERRITWRRSGDDQKCLLQVWLPVQLDNGGWVSVVHITNLGLPSVAALPGEDPLDALVSALAFVRDVMERAEGNFLFGAREREMGGLPVNLDRGFAPGVLLDIETQAIRLADALALNHLRRISTDPV